MLTVSDVEVECADEWFTAHEQERRAWWRWRRRHILTYAFVGTGIGTAVIAHCSCGARENVTDFSNW